MGRTAFRRLVLAAACCTVATAVVGLTAASSWAATPVPAYIAFGVPANLLLPDTNASVNANPNGVHSDALAGGVAPADSHGCPSSYACAWVDASFGTPMGEWAGTNPNFSAFSQAACNWFPPDQNWNDCASSVDNAGTQCTVDWYWDINYGGAMWALARGSSSGSLGSWNDEISSNGWCKG
jgi:hypothetical protein